MEGSHSVSEGQVHSAKPHPSAKHRRNRKKHADEIKGLALHEDHHKRGSSEDNSSDEDHHVKEGIEHKAPHGVAEHPGLVPETIASSVSLTNSGNETHVLGDCINDSNIPSTVESRKTDVDEFRVDTKQQLEHTKKTTAPEEERSTDANDTKERIDPVDVPETAVSSTHAIVETTSSNLDDSHIVLKQSMDLVNELGVPGRPIEGAIGKDSIKGSSDGAAKNAVSDSENPLHKETCLDRGNDKNDSSSRYEETIDLMTKDATKSSYSLEPDLLKAKIAVTKTFLHSDSEKHNLGTITTKSVIESEGIKENDCQIGGNVNSAKMISASSTGNGAMLERNIQTSKNTVMDGSAPTSLVSRIVESRFGSLEQKMVLKASSMRCDSLDTDAYEDAPDTLETCSIGGSIEEFDMFQSPTDTSMGHDGGIKEKFEERLLEKPIDLVETAPIIVFNTEDLKAPSLDNTLHQDMSVPQVESSRKSDEVEMEEMNEIKSTNPDAQQEDGQGIALQDLLAKEKVEKKKEPIGNSDASVSIDSDTNIKPKTKSFWAHCLCCAAVQ